MIQQASFLRFKDLYKFLRQHHPKLADEIVQAYIHTMRWYYRSNFTRYSQALEKLKVHVMDKYDVLGHLDPSRRGQSVRAMFLVSYVQLKKSMGY